ncbi:enhancer of rudimentary [Linnemannia elongata]|nr:enhancer of rudimentary [Linnemannia elongata]
MSSVPQNLAFSTSTNTAGNNSPCHTILLVQKTQAASSKTYIECSSVAVAMDEVIKMYEDYLKNKYPNKERIEFDVNEVLDMVFNLPDCAALVLDTRSGTYIPHDKSWIQKQVVVRAQSRAR